MKDVTVVFLSCKRIDLFKANFRAFWKCCKDRHLVDSFIVIDDNSNPKDRYTIANLCLDVDIPHMVIHKDIMKGLAQSLNIALDLCKTKYLFIVEDDWLFIKEGDFLGWCIRIMDRHDHVKKVCLDFSSSGKAKENIHWTDIYSMGEDKYFIDEYQDKTQWPSFTFRQGLLDAQECKNSIGYFEPVPKLSHDGTPPTCETDYAVRFCRLGFRTAYILDSYTKECFGESCFDLNKINRQDETK